MTFFPLNSSASEITEWKLEELEMEGTKQCSSREVPGKMETLADGVFFAYFNNKYNKFEYIPKCLNR